MEIKQEKILYLPDTRLVPNPTEDFLRYDIENNLPNGFCNFHSGDSQHVLTNANIFIMTQPETRDGWNTFYKSIFKKNEDPICTDCYRIFSNYKKRFT